MATAYKQKGVKWHPDPLKQNSSWVPSVAELDRAGHGMQAAHQVPPSMHGVTNHHTNLFKLGVGTKSECPWNWAEHCCEALWLGTSFSSKPPKPPVTGPSILINPPTSPNIGGWGHLKLPQAELAEVLGHMLSQVPEHARPLIQIPHLLSALLDPLVFALPTAAIQLLHWGLWALSSQWTCLLPKNMLKNEGASLASYKVLPTPKEDLDDETCLLFSMQLGKGHSQTAVVLLSVWGSAIC